jgi:hypothetical protein
MAVLTGVVILGFGLWASSNSDGIGEVRQDPPSAESIPAELDVAVAPDAPDLQIEKSEPPQQSSRESAATDTRVPLSITIPQLMALPEKSVSEVWAKIDAIEAELYRWLDPIVREAFASGYSEPARQSSDGMCAFGRDLWNDRNGSSDSLIVATRQDGNEAPRRVVLAKSDFPELSVLEEASQRLRRLAQTLPGSR